LFGAPSKPTETGNDLFGAPAESKPAAAPSTPASKLATPPQAAPAGDDLFGTPASQPAAPAEKKSDGPAMTPPANGDQPPAEKDDKNKKKDDDLFGGVGEILREPGGLASTEMRHWVDNTGRFSCEGRLIRVMDAQVVLLKDNGRNATVPIGRLSQTDLSFVNRQANAERAQAADQTAQYIPTGR
jgi:hypothetical protein